MTIETRSSGRANPRANKLIDEDRPPVTTDWRHRAACRNEDPELFFPVGNTGPALLWIEDAKRICNYRCPVRDACLNWALTVGEDAGVWGGMSEDERRALKRRVVRAESRNRARAEKAQVAA